MDQFSFQGPFAYRWIDDVPVERIDLRSGERCPIEMGTDGLASALFSDRHENGQPVGPPPPAEEGNSDRQMRAAMAAWN